MIKTIWNKFTDIFGSTPIHPQFIMKRYDHLTLLEVIKHAKGDLIDIGCGRMPYKNELLQHIDKYVGLDHPQTSKLYQSDVKPDILADASSIPVKNRSFDIALMIQVLEYIYPIEEAFKEFWLLSLNVFLLKRIKDVISTSSYLKLPILVLLTFITIPIIFISNILVLLTLTVTPVLPKYPNYFPLNYLIVAKRK